MKRIGWAVLILFLAVEAGGCATVQRKFTRKKKEPAHVAQVVYIENEPYQKKYSNGYYYKTHFTLWKGWQDELIAGFGGNRKKTARNAEEAVSHLEEMQKYLAQAKQQELGMLTLQLRGLHDKIEIGQYSWSEVGPMKIELEKMKRLIENNFYYEKVKGDILPETVDLGEKNSSPAPAPAS
jgi:hypothetical protein